MRLFVIFLLCVASSVALAQRELTTIALNYASPEQLVEVIRPYLSAGSSVSSYQNQLVLNVTEEELTKTRELLTQLDRAGRQLLVSLRSDGAGSDSQRGVDVDGEITSGNTAIISRSGNTTTETRTTVRVHNSRGTSANNGNQSVRATEGMPAFIATGITAPVQTYTTAPDGSRQYQQDYIDAVAGFFATTWINDDTVRINIEQSNNQLEGQTITTQQLQSEVNGALGQWLPLGVINDTSSRQDQGIGSRGLSRRTSSTELSIKVELLD